MYSYFETLLKQMFLEKYPYESTVENTSDADMDKLNITDEFREILDKVAIGMIYDTFENEKLIEAMLKLARVERIILAFNIILEIELPKIAFLLDTSLSSTYAQKSTALRRLKKELKRVS